jgi:uncharacterized protein YcbX
MVAVLTAINVYPTKGLGGTTVDSAELVKGVGIPGDRAFAFHFVDRLEEGLAPSSLLNLEWRRKQNFAVQADWPVLAAVSARYDAPSARMSVTFGNQHLEADLRDSAQREALADFVEMVLRSSKPSPAAVHPDPSALRLVGNPDGGTRFPDRGGSDVSILNLASLREVARALGQTVDVGRFRGNLIVDGWEPWAELTLVGKTIRLGAVDVTVKGTIGRCHNVNVDQKTGDDGVAVLKTLESAFGHTKFGVVCGVTDPGVVSVGDAVSVEAH